MVEEAIHIRIGNKQISIAAVALVTALSGYPLANWISPSFRADAFTSSDGYKLEDRIEILEFDMSTCQRRDYLHREKQAEALATIRAKTISNEYLIKQCVHNTEQ